jgi:hypothetical protein
MPNAEDVVAAAEAEIRALVPEFTAWARDRVAILQTLAGLIGAEPRLKESLLRAVALVAHDIKGMGGSLGFERASAVAESLGRCADVPLRADALPQLIHLVGALDEAIATPGA